MLNNESFYAIDCALQSINSDLSAAVDHKGDHPHVCFRSDGFTYCVEFGFGGHVLLCSESGERVSDDPADDDDGVVRTKDLEAFLRRKIRAVLDIVKKFDAATPDES
jgi:hypothetical protein